MATRSTIAIEYADGTVGQIYCHWDGYLAHNGQLLLQYYSNPFVLRDLIDLGDISSLGKNIGSKHPFSQFRAKDPALSDEENARLDAELKADYEAAKAAGATTFYGRDRGETGCEAKKFVSFSSYVVKHQYEEYEYILRNIDGKATWFVAEHGNNYVELAQAIMDEQDSIAQEETA